MPNDIENLIRKVYENWKSGQVAVFTEHPDEVILSDFLEGSLAAEEILKLKTHLLACEECAERFMLNLVDLKETQVPQELLDKVRHSLLIQANSSVLEIMLKLKEKFLELINTTGDVLVGQELLPAPVLRSRSIRDFQDEVVIFKDFEEIRLEVKVENKGKKSFNLHIIVRQKLTQEVIKNLRVTLISNEREIESYLTNSASVIFEHLLLGKYKLEITTIDSLLASILLDITV